MVAYVQGAQVTSSGTSVTVAFGSNTGAGHAIVVAGRINATSPTATCSDTQGNTYLNPSSIYNGAASEAMQSDIFVTANSAAAADTITYASSVSGTISVAIHEYSGLLTSNATIVDPTGFGSQTSGATTSTAPQTVPARTTNATALLFGAFSLYSGTATFTPGNMGTAVASTVRQSVADKLITQDNLTFTSNFNEANGTLSAADYWNALFVALVAPRSYLSPIGVESQFFTNAGAVLNGGKINTYLAGTSTTTPTYTDYSLTTANPNPIILNSYGRLPASIWQPAGVPIKVVITDASNNVLMTMDNIAGINDPSALGAPGIGATFYPLSLAEDAAIANFGVTGPSNFSYPPGSALRFGVDPSGTVDSTAAIQNWIDCTWAIYYYTDSQGLWNGSAGGSPVMQLPPGKYKVSNTMYLPNGVTFRGTGHPAHTINHTRIIMNSTGYTPARTWAANAIIPAGAAIQATVSSTLYYFTTTNGGVSGTSTPAWSTSGTTTDGTVTWSAGGRCTSGDNRNNPMFKFGRGSKPRVGSGPNGVLVNGGITTTIQELEFWYVGINGSFSNPLQDAMGYAYGDYPLGGVLAFDVDAADSDVIDCVFQFNPAAFWCSGIGLTSATRGDGFTGDRGVGVYFDRCEFDVAAAHVYAIDSYLDVRFNNCEMFGGPHIYEGCTGTVVYEGGSMTGNSRIDAGTVANTFTTFRFNNVYVEPPGSYPMLQLNSLGVCDISNNTMPTAANGGPSGFVVTNAVGGKINNNMINNSGYNASPGTSFLTYTAAIKLIDCQYVDVKGNTISANSSASYNGFGILTGSNIATSQYNFIDGNSVTAQYNAGTYNGQSRYINIASGDILGDNYNQHDGSTGKSAGQTRFLAQMSQRLISVTYGTSVAINAGLGNSFSISATNSTSFTIGAPTNPALGQQLTIWVINNSSGSLGTITWTGGTGGYKLAAWTNPASGYSRSITFLYNGTDWYEISRTPSDVPN